MTGLEAARRVIEEAAREEFLSVELIARALRSDRRTILRNWKHRNYPVTRIGRRTLLPSALVIMVYFPHATSPVHSAHPPA